MDAGLWVDWDAICAKLAAMAPMWPPGTASGYHPVTVPYGYESYYLNVMAGPTREWHFRNDPAHDWMLRRP
mgnify:CR=1 FL=1